jgi:hypothetical protein
MSPSSGATREHAEFGGAQNAASFLKSLLDSKCRFVSLTISTVRPGAIADETAGDGDEDVGW